MFLHRETCEGGLDHTVVEVAFTDGGLDLAEKPDTDPADLAGELARLEEACGTGVVRMTQVHGADVALVDERPDVPPAADGLVTTRTGLALVARAADCVPVLLADPAAGVIAAVHAGRPGLVAGVVPAAVRRMHDLGATAVRAWVGPHVCGRCYEVPAPMREDVAARVPESWAETSWGTPALDIGAGVRAQLDRLGADHVSVGGCTREDERLWSYRRDGAAAGRLGGLVWRHA